jgi:hypothetical protein
MSEKNGLFRLVQTGILRYNKVSKSARVLQAPGALATMLRMATMFHFTTFESVFWFVATITLLWTGVYFIHKIDDLQVKLSVSERLQERSTQALIDAGLQLFNLQCPNQKRHPGYVYVVKSDTGHYKIGYTTDFKSRAKTFGVKLPVEIEFLVLIETPNCSGLESMLHTQYQHKRVNGEWFDLSDMDLLWLKSFPGNQIQ